MSRTWNGNAVLGPVLALLLLAGAGCAAKIPSIDQARIRDKLDLRLQSALGGRNMGEVLGEYIQVSVRMKKLPTDEDMSQLATWGVPGESRGPIVTLILEPSKVVEVAALDQVDYIELAARNAPAPTIPPQPPPAG